MPMRVHVVEDDPSLRTLAEVILTVVAGWQVSLSASGEEALARVPGLDADVLLIDMMMPGMDGLTTLAQLRSIGVETPAIFLTAKAQRQEREAYAAAGALDTIAKPYDPLTLATRIEAALASAKAS